MSYENLSVSVTAAIGSLIPFTLMSLGIEIEHGFGILLLFTLISPAIAFIGLLLNRKTPFRNLARACLFVSIVGLLLTASKFVNG